MAPPSVSVVVVAHDMARELPRTIGSLAAPYQQGLTEGDHEVIVVDNGSAEPVPLSLLDDVGVPGTVLRVDDAPPSPAQAANLGLARAEGALVGLIIDGARMASPGLVATARRAAGVAPDPVVAAHGWHLGPARHMEAAEIGYDQAVEDDLLQSIGWPTDGYRLFEVSTLAGSSGRGWFGPMGESSALFLPRPTWEELGGLDEAFSMPGGGLVNHDLLRRACDRQGAELVVLLGEGTFHQIHGGAATGRRFSWDEMHADYEQLRGCRYRPPQQPPIYVGGVPPAAVGQLAESVRLAQRRLGRSVSSSAAGSPQG
ncbi:MAG: glycosyltransferase family 2 protein [Acidimicrobiia bacterium]|nr:glycosyltransferase family 2 protein [Acidimicrobiia bacterium]